MTERILRVEARHALAGTPARLPLQAMLYVPDPPGAVRGVRPFNLPAWVATLLRFSESSGKVLDARLWAPRWDRAATEAFLQEPPRVPEWMWELPAEPLGRAVPMAPWVSGFPPVESLLVESWGALPETVEIQFDIVHFAGRMAGEGVDDGPALNLGEDGTEGAESLLANLGTFGTRLLVLQIPRSDFESAANLGERLVRKRGPAVLAVAGPGTVTDLLLAQLYAVIVHGQPLSEVGDSPAWMKKAGLRMRWILGGGGEDLLRYEPWLRAVATEAHILARSVARIDVDRVRQRAKTLLHRSQLESQSRTLDSLQSRSLEVAPQLHAYASEIEHMLETDPRERHTARMEELAAKAAVVEEAATSSIEEARELEQQVEEQAARAPRVLNANFRRAGESDEKAILDPREGLVAGQEYDLLVDVGPVWSSAPSLVRGKTGFPEEALATDSNGYVVQVVLSSDDFDPPIVTGEIWVPRATGRSFPMIDGRRAPDDGPLPLTVRAPSSNTEKPFVVRGRLALYYENNVIQSAAVRAGVVREPGRRLKKPNLIEVDFALSASLQQVDERFAGRRLRLGGVDARAEALEFPVMLSLAMNDDGTGTHRIAARLKGDGAAIPSAWLDYNEKAASLALEDARQGLIECFFERDRNGNANPKRSGLDQRNARKKRMFLKDLERLAIVGNQLQVKAVNQVVAGGGVDWVRQVREALAEPCVIQIARTKDAGYAFPWALVYDIQLPSALTPDKLRVCDLLDQWDEDGVMAGNRGDGTCPHRDESWHQEDVLCPYGFWGLRHVIEQPIPPMMEKDGKKELVDVTSRITVRPQVVVSAGVTRDSKLDRGGKIDAHLADIEAMGYTLRGRPGNPAIDANGLRTLLPDASLVYFLCHGRRDVGRDEPFLGLGPNHDPEPPEHRVYPSLLSNWALSPVGPGLGTWSTRRPLVFINGCGTAALTPGDILNFVTTFGNMHASGVIGTEISVELPLAIEVARSVLSQLAGSGTVGDALYKIRWELVEKGNLLGLAYTPYSMADLRFVRD